MIQRFTAFLLFLVVFSFLSFAQEEEDEKYSRNIPNKEKKADILDRIHFGGGAGAQFGARTYIQVAPQAGFDITKRFTGGLGINYTYYRYNLDVIYGSGGIYQSSIYGGTTFLNYRLFESVLLHTEYEALNYEYYDNTLPGFNRRWLGSFFIGGGYRQYFNEGRSYIQVLLLYNLNYQPNSPYSSPLVPRISIYF
ncbi:MAG TPA: hypothetical protein P5050_11345 [Bacteroidia bacterium]|nr:hypothetical protein [Bacteroidia bacterium]HRS59800.1 hypothetical protein [Bacteroidia bacterium]HRU68518.1 hypothetical protein [Bacteroidia bacterium]